MTSFLFVVVKIKLPAKGNFIEGKISADSGKVEQMRGWKIGVLGDREIFPLGG